jgi:carbamoyl-phosphate synthase large subunit
MGLDTTFAAAFAKAELAASTDLPARGRVFISVRDHDKGRLEPIVRGLAANGFELIATDGTANAITRLDLPCERVNKVIQGSPHIVDRMRDGEIALVINTPDAAGEADSFSIRRTALELRLPFFTTLAGAAAAVEAIASMRNSALSVRALQDYTV